MLNVSELKNVLEDFKSEMEDIKSTQRIIQECCSHSENVSVVPISNTDCLPVHAVSLSKPTSLENDLTKASYSEKASPLPLLNVYTQPNLSLQIAGLSQRVEELYIKYNKISAAFEKLEINVDDLEQNSRRNCVIMHGFKTESLANLNKYDEFEEKIITTLNNYLKVNLNSNDIDITHQLSTSKFGKVPVIIKFVKRSTRNTVFNKKRLLHKTGFALTESLTKRRLWLFSLAKEKFGKDSVWTSNGSIYCRPVHDGDKFLISSIEDIESNNTT